MLGQQFVQFLLDFNQFAGMNLDIGSLSAQAAANQRLVNHDAAVRQGESFAFRTGRQQECAHAGSLAEAQGGYVRLNEIHGIKHRHAGRYRSSGRVDVKENVFIGIFAFQKQHLRHNQIRRMVGNGAD